MHPKEQEHQELITALRHCAMDGGTGCVGCPCIAPGKEGDCQSLYTRAADTIQELKAELQILRQREYDRFVNQK